jgi:hypothetical protein
MPLRWRSQNEQQLDEKIRLYENQLSAKTAMRYEKVILFREIGERIAELRVQINPRPSRR